MAFSKNPVRDSFAVLFDRIPCRLSLTCVDFLATETPDYGSSRPVRIFPIGSIRDADLLR